MDWIEPAIRSLHAYPRWLVAACGVIVGLAVLWVIGKILKWTLYLMVALAVLLLGLGAFYWWLGG